LKLFVCYSAQAQSIAWLRQTVVPSPNAAAQKQPLFQLRHLSGLWFQGLAAQFRDVNVHGCCTKSLLWAKKVCSQPISKGPWIYHQI